MHGTCWNGLSYENTDHDETFDLMVKYYKYTSEQHTKNDCKMQKMYILKTLMLNGNLWQFHMVVLHGTGRSL